MNPSIIILILASLLPLSSTQKSCKYDSECSSDRQCTNSHCVCRDGFYVDPSDHSPVPTCHRRIYPYSDTCRHDYECGINAECTESNGITQCSCKNGYYTYTAPSRDLHCFKQHGCKTDSDCKEFQNKICSNGVCNCKHRYSFHRKDQSCVQEIAPLGGKCYSNWPPEIDVDLNRLGCGSNTVCAPESPESSTKICKCYLGFIPVDDFDCRFLNCSTDSECFSHFPNSICSGNRCDCATHFDWINGTCLLRDDIRKLGEDCRSKNCGSNTICDSKDHKCQCVGGAKPKEDSVNCHKVKCSSDADCKLEQPNWICDTNRLTCMAISKGFGLFHWWMIYFVLFVNFGIFWLKFD